MICYFYTLLGPPQTNVFYKLKICITLGIMPIRYFKFIPLATIYHPVAQDILRKLN